jgi:hypothetical protein
MGQKLLLAAGTLAVVAALGIGAAGLAGSTWTGGTRAGAAVPGYRPAGMMGGYGPGGTMGGGHGAAIPAGTQTISIDQAQQNVEQYVARYGGSNLVLDELIEFQDNFYAIVKEKGTGTGAFELLVNRVTGAVMPEPGPNMMWNTKYGMASAGMMGFFRPSGAMTVNAERAGQVAQAWLDDNVNGARIETPDAFYGYFTVHFTQNGEVAGMLSVNGYTGQVWYHTWHGAFVQEREVGS